MTGARRSPVWVEAGDPHTCTLDVRRHVLAHVPFFADLDADAIADVDRRCRVDHLDTGEAVHHMGQAAERLYVIATGTAKLVRPGRDGTEVLLDVLRPGDFFGALPVLGAATYTDSVWALTPLCILSLDVGAFDAVLDEHPSVARAGLGVMAERLTRSQSQAQAMAAADSRQRIAAALAMLADRAGVRRRHDVLLDLPLARDDLAGLTGTASETVSRVLARFRRDGVIETGRRWIAVTDLDALREAARI